MAPRTSKRRSEPEPAPSSPPADDSGSELSEEAEPSSSSRSPPTETISTVLNFKEPLLGKPGRPIPVATLLTRLQNLSNELKAHDQEDSEDFKASCRLVAEQLSDHSILAHKDKGVRAHAAACIVDLLALCAPDAPFSIKSLKAIFEMFIKTVFTALADPGNAYNTQHVYVLESLASFKSILIINDLPNAGRLMTQLFTIFFDIIGGTAKGNGSEEPVSKHVEYHMLQILVALVDESDIMPPEVVDIIVAQFLRVDPHLAGQKAQISKKGVNLDVKQTTLIRQELPPAYVMARSICISVPEKMAREISKYFIDVIVDASGTNPDSSKRKSTETEDEIDEGPVAPSEEDLEEIEKAHRLVRELWRACPPVLQNVIPQLEAELATESNQLRALAVETLGDIISGIGSAGPPPPPSLDPTAYPPTQLIRAETQNFNPWTTPSSPQPFQPAHPQAYSAFLSRRQDKSVVVRAAWTTAIGRILSTNAGGVGLNHAEERRLLEDLARMLNDSEEKVRLAAVKATSLFNCHDVVNKLGLIGGIDSEGSVLANLASRVKDKRHPVRVEAMGILSRMWAAVHADIADGNEQVVTALGGAPSHILNTFRVNTPDFIELLYKVLFEILLPLTYPPIKNKKDKINGSSQRVKDSQAQGSPGDSEPDADLIRAGRILVMIRGLDPSAKQVFFAICLRQVQLTKYMQAYLQNCEDYNGGIVEKDCKAAKDRLSQIISVMAQFFEDKQKVNVDLLKFAKAHDRRSYQLIRFCMDPKSDYRTVMKAMRELSKRVSESSNPGLMETLTPWLYRVSLILYNRSHVPAILQYARTNDKGLSAVSHEVLKDMSQQTPEVLETHIREMCQSLQDDMPSVGKPNSSDAVDNLKACAAFAKKFPHKLPQDRKFIHAMTGYTLYGTPPAAGKHAVSIIIAASNKKELMAKDLVQKCLKGFEYGGQGFLTRLATISQIMLLAPNETEEYTEAVFDIALEGILIRNRDSKPSPGYIWDSSIPEECAAKIWAVRIVVNRIRSHPTAGTLTQVAAPVYNTLLTIVQNEGELSAAKDTPAEHKPQLRLLSANSLLKLSRSQRHDALLDPLAFTKLAGMAQDGLFEVRKAFMHRLKKYLSRNILPPRFYTIAFLFAYEPDQELMSETQKWLKARAAFLASQGGSIPVSGKTPGVKAHTTMEAIIARLLSLLAHHQDYAPGSKGLLGMGQYIIFYLTSVATADNISLIYHIAQRVKAHRDAVLEHSASAFSEKIKALEMRSGVDYDTRLHTLSDLACAAIRALVEAHNWNLETLPGRAKLPVSLLTEIRDHDEAITIAEKDFLPEGVPEGIESLIRDALRKKAKPDVRKRKSEVVGNEESAKAKRIKKLRAEKRPSSSSKRPRTPNRKGDDREYGSEGEERMQSNREAEKKRRKSGRASNAIKYVERDDDEDDKEMLDGVAEWEYENGERQTAHASSDEDEIDEDEETEPQDEQGENEPTAGEDEDILMTDEEVPRTSLEEDGGTPSSSPPLPPTLSASRRGKVTPNSKSAKATPAKSQKVAANAISKANARVPKAGTRARKVSPVVGKENQKALPTRAGRATRSTAAAS